MPVLMPGDMAFTALSFCLFSRRSPIIPQSLTSLTPPFPSLNFAGNNLPPYQLQINFNMSFLDLPCEYLSVDALDVLGSNRVNITGELDTTRERLSADIRFRVALQKSKTPVKFYVVLILARDFLLCVIEVHSWLR